MNEAQLVWCCGLNLKLGFCMDIIFHPTVIREDQSRAVNLNWKMNSSPVIIATLGHHFKSTIHPKIARSQSQTL